MRTYRPGILRGLTSLIALLALAACGGGGGDSPPPLTPVVYTGRDPDFCPLFFFHSSNTTAVSARICDHLTRSIAMAFC